MIFYAKSLAFGKITEWNVLNMAKECHLNVVQVFWRSNFCAVSIWESVSHAHNVLYVSWEIKLSNWKVSMVKKMHASD